MQYVLKNLKSFAKNYTGIFVLIIVCQFVCILLTFFSFGVYQNFLNESQNIQNADDEAEYIGYKCFQAKGELPDNAEIYPAQLEGFFNSVVDILGDKIDMITVDCDENVELLLQYRDGKLLFPEEFESNMKAYFEWTNGRVFSDYEFSAGESVCIAPSGCCEEYYSDQKNTYTDPETEEQVPIEYPNKAYMKNDKWFVSISGKEYECIGFCNFVDLYYIPVNNFPAALRLKQLPVIDLKYNLTPEENDRMQALYDEYFPTFVSEYYELTLVDNEKVYYYNTNMIISALIAVISAVDLALIMNYILTRRRKILAVFRINGCTVGQARRIYITEILLILNVVFIAAIIIWCSLLLPGLDPVFKYIRGAFSIRVYALIYLSYMAVTYAVMNIMTVLYLKRSPVDLIKKR